MKLSFSALLILFFTANTPQFTQTISPIMASSQALILGIETYTFGKMSLTNLQNYEQKLLGNEKELTNYEKLSSKFNAPLIISIGAGILWNLKLYLIKDLLSFYYHERPKYFFASSLAYIIGLLIGKYGNRLMNKDKQNIQK